MSRSSGSESKQTTSKISMVSPPTVEMKVASGPATLVDALRVRAAEAAAQDGHAIVYLQDDVETVDTLATLYADALEYLAALQSQAGLQQGDFVLLQMPTRREHFRVFWACAVGGIIPVTVAVPQDFEKSTSLVDKIRGVIATLVEVSKVVVLTEDSVLEPLTHALNADPKQGQQRTRVESVNQLLAKAATATTPVVAKEADIKATDVLFLQLTSGSTGIPKCIQETHRGIITQIVASAEVCGYSYGKTSLNWLPFDHVVPMLTTHLRDIYLGMKQVQIPTHEILIDPLLWMHALEKYEVNFSWSPNFGYNLVNQACKKLDSRPVWDLSSLEYLINAGEQVTRSVCDAFIANTGIRPTVMQPSFGMAESCTCITYCTDYNSQTSTFRAVPESVAGVLQQQSDDNAPAMEFMDLGPVVRSVEIRIAVMGQPTVPVPSENVIGHFQIKGPVVTPGYVNRPEANKEAFVGDGWFDSGDLGFMRNGRLYLTGRYKESICIRGANLFCYEIESQVESVPAVLATFVAATSVHSETTGTEELLVFFSPDKELINTSCLESGTLDADMRQLMVAVRQKVSEATGISPKVCVPVLPANFHKTTSGKIQRIKFRNLYTEGHFKKLLSPPVEVPSLLKRGCFEHTWVPRVIEESEMNRPLAIRIIDPSNVCRDADELKHAIEAEQQLCVTQNPDVILFIGALGTTPESPTEAASHVTRVLSQAAEILRSSSDKTCFVAVASTATDMDKLVGASLHCFVRSLATEEPQRKPMLLAWDRSKSSLPTLVRAISAPILGSESDVLVQKDGLFVGKLQPKSFVPRGGLQLEEKATYAITGGTGALGLELAKYLAKCGACHIALISRSGESSAVTRNLEPLRKHGVTVKVITGDIAIPQDVKRIVDSIAQHPSLSLKGIFHLAGVYKSGRASECNEENLTETLAAKTFGAALLHAATVELDLDHFVMFSSVAASIGPVGYNAYAAAYAAANAYLDELSNVRRKQGLPALSVQWGPWDHVGGMAGNVNFSFFDRIQVSGGMTALGLLMEAQAETGLLLTEFDFSVYKCALAMDSSFVVPPLLAELVAKAESSTPLGMSGPSDESAISKALEEMIRDIIGMVPPSDVSVMALGLDSVGAMELNGLMSKKFGVNLPFTFVFNHPTLESMVEFFTQTSSQATTPAAAPKRIVAEYKNEPRMEFRQWEGSMTQLDKPLYILGSGGHTRTVISALKALNMPIAGIFTNLEKHVGTTVMGVQVLGLLEDVPPPAKCFLHIGLGQPLIKQEWAARFPDHAYVPIVHPLAVVDESCTMGQGSFVGPLAVVDGLVRIGAHSIVEVHALVGHDTEIGSFTLVGGMAAVAGSSVIGDGVVLGTHSSTAPKVRLGNRAVLGSGSSAHSDIAEGCTGIGVPAEVLYRDVDIKM